MKHLLLAVLLLLNACTFDLRGDGEPLRVEVSVYPETVPQGGSFEVFVDVLSVTEPLEVAVVPPEEVSVDETIGGSYVRLDVSAAEDAPPGTYTLTVDLKSGTAASQLALGFSITPEDAP